jgi:hypothetical protein
MTSAFSVGAFVNINLRSWQPTSGLSIIRQNAAFDSNVDE